MSAATLSSQIRSARSRSNPVWCKSQALSPEAAPGNLVAMRHLDARRGEAARIARSKNEPKRPRSSRERAVRKNRAPYSVVDLRTDGRNSLRAQAAARVVAGAVAAARQEGGAGGVEDPRRARDRGVRGGVIYENKSSAGVETRPRFQRPSRKANAFGNAGRGERTHSFAGTSCSPP